MAGDCLRRLVATGGRYTNQVNYRPTAKHPTISAVFSSLCCVAGDPPVGLVLACVGVMPGLLVFSMVMISPLYPVSPAAVLMDVLRHSVWF